MVASVYIKDENIHLYNEKSDLSGIGGIAYELGRPLLDFVCYDPEQFDDAFSIIASAFDNEYAHMGAKEPEFIATLKELMGEMQQREVYLFFYEQILMDFIFAFIDSPQTSVAQLAEKISGAEEKLGWAMDFTWPTPPTGKVFADKEKRLFRAAMDVVALLSEDIREKQAFMIGEIELLISFRETMGVPQKSRLEYLYSMEQFRRKNVGCYFYLENPFRTFYGVLPSQEIVQQLYEIDTIDDLFRFEFVKMIEHDVFIKKCKNCERFFIPRRRADAEYCDRIYGDTHRKCSEIGATLRYERKVAGNPILEAHKKAYRRFNSRVRNKKMTQAEFMAWSDEAAKKRDACLAGELPFDEFVDWLEQGRIRKSRRSSP